MWKKGQTGNPEGGRAIPEDVRKARKLSQRGFEVAASRYFMMTEDELNEELASKKLNRLEKMVGSMIKKAADEQDVLRAQFILDRSIGKVKETFEVKHEMAGLTDAQLIEQGRLAIQILEQAQLQQRQKSLAIEGEIVDIDSPASNPPSET